jgi:chromosome partitioning protein
MTRIIAITNPKGGTGKSTTTAALAQLAARDGLRTLLIDLDPQQTASFLSRGTWESEAETAAAMFNADNPTAPSALAKPTIYDYELVTAGASLADAEDELRKDPFGPSRLRKLFKRDVALNQYDVVFIDTSANKTRMLASVLMAATHVLIPMQASNVTLKELTELLPIINTINEQRSDFGDVPLINYGILFTMVKDGTRANEAVISALTEQLHGLPGVPVSPIRIPHSIAVEDAALARAPVTIARPSESVSKRYGLFWDSISERQNTLKVVSV